MQLSRRVFVTLAALLAVLLVAGCRAPASKPGAVGQTTPTLTAAPLASLDDLKPVDSGPGLAVCEPVAGGADAATAALGAGCARWLQLHAAGQGALGQTPPWNHLFYAQQEMGRADLRLQAEAAATLARMTGVTHVATGQIAGNAARCTLTYQLYAAPAGQALQAVGAPLQAAGTAEQVLAALPKMARQMCAALGVATPQLPAQVGATPAQMALLGQVARDPYATLPAALQRQLDALAPRLPLAAMLALLRAPDAATAAALGTRLLQQAPGNALALEHIMRSAAVLGNPRAGVIAPAQAAFLRVFWPARRAFEKRFPNNYALATGLSNDPASTPQRRSATMELAVRCAPRSPWAWDNLSRVLMDEADATRRARTIGEMNQQEMATVTKLYPLCQAAAQRAVRLDERNGDAWRQLAVSACFNGDGATADSAFWKALALDPDNTDVYSWGLQMYQAKWFPDEAKLLKVAEQALADERRTPALATKVLWAVNSLDEATQDSERVQKLVWKIFAQWVPGSAGPVNSGPGLVVCEPVMGAVEPKAAGSNPALADFGAGCGRWLHFVAAPQPEFGKTPLWSSVDDARRWNRWPDLRLTPLQAATLGRALGVTHVATGQIAGTATRCTLTYQLYAVDGDAPQNAPKAVGAPLAVTGSTAQVVAGLPGLARQLAARLGAGAPRIDAPDASVADVSALGRLPRVVRQPLTGAAARQLLDLAARQPVAGLIALSQITAATLAAGAAPPDPKTGVAAEVALRRQVAARLSRQAPDNPLVATATGDAQPRDLAPLDKTIERNATRWPRNYLWQTANRARRRAAYQGFRQYEAAWQATRCAPRNPAAWTQLSRTLSELADDARQGSAATAIPSDLNRYLNLVYALAYGAARRAVRLAPNDSHAWQELTLSGTFAGASGADALWKAVELDVNDDATYRWGLQMLQPKWGGDPPELLKLVDRVANDPRRFRRLSPDVVEALQTVGKPDEKTLNLLTRAWTELEALARDTGNLHAQHRLAWFFQTQNQPERTRAAFAAWTRLDPGDPEAHFRYGGFLHNHGDRAGASAQYRAALRLAPLHAPSLLYLGAILVDKKQFAEADKMLRLVVQIQPDWDAPHYYRGNALAGLGRLDEARAEWRKTLQMDADWGSYGQYAMMQLFAPQGSSQTRLPQTRHMPNTKGTAPSQHRMAQPHADTN